MSFDYMALWDNREILLDGLLNTIIISFVAIPIGILLGVFVCLMRISNSKILSALAIIYIECMRNIPLLIIIFMAFYALPFYGIRMSGMFTGFICLSIYGGAYFAEIFRGGVQSIPTGQFDACKALGFRYFFYMRKIIFPQLYAYIFPPSTNIALILIKDSSLLSMITVAELTYAAHDVNGRTFTPVETFTAIAIAYWMISSAFLWGAAKLRSKIDFTDNDISYQYR